MEQDDNTEPSRSLASQGSSGNIYAGILAQPMADMTLDSAATANLDPSSAENVPRLLLDRIPSPVETAPNESTETPPPYNPTLDLLPPVKLEVYPVARFRVYINCMGGWAAVEAAFFSDVGYKFDIF